MVTKKALPTRDTAGELDTRDRIVKIRLSEDEMRSLRVAAALQDIPAATFSRTVVIERAEAILKQYRMSNAAGK